MADLSAIVADEIAPRTRREMYENQLAQHPRKDAYIAQLTVSKTPSNQLTYGIDLRQRGDIAADQFQAGRTLATNLPVSRKQVNAIYRANHQHNPLDDYAPQAIAQKLPMVNAETVPPRFRVSNARANLAVGVSVKLLPDRRLAVDADSLTAPRGASGGNSRPFDYAKDEVPVERAVQTNHDRQRREIQQAEQRARYRRQVREKQQRDHDKDDDLEP